MKKFTLLPWTLPLVLVACGALPATPSLQLQGASVQVCVAGCASQTDTRWRSYLVNFKELLSLRANSTRTSVQFGKDAADPACTLNVTTPLNSLALERAAGDRAVTISNDVVKLSRWHLACPTYDSGWNDF